MLAKLTWSRVRNGGCRHGDGNANTTAAAVLSATTTAAASTEGGKRGERERMSLEGNLLRLDSREKMQLETVKPANQ